MTPSGAGPLRVIRGRLSDFAHARVGGSALILAYHRVATLDRDPQLLAVRPDRFAAQMRVLAEVYRPISLRELLDARDRRDIPDRAVAVTFDDGYADNLHAAAPLLAASGIPATLFVSSGYVGGDREFWWDELDRLLLSPGPLPNRIEVEADGRRFCAEPADPERGLAEEAGAKDWNVLSMAEASPRQRLYANLCEFVRPLPPDDREEILRALRSCIGAVPQVRDTHRQLTAAEVTALDGTDGLEVGSHTVTHPVLSTLPADRQRSEILDDLDTLSRLCGHRPETFSYPFGGPEDYGAETVALVREAGFRGACATHVRAVKRWTDPFLLPRCMVRDWDEATFAEHLEGWFGGRR